MTLMGIKMITFMGHIQVMGRFEVSPFMGHVQVMGRFEVSPSVHRSFRTELPSRS
jgi:hypothetical protein